MRTSKILPTSQTWTMLLQAYIEAVNYLDRYLFNWIA